MASAEEESEGQLMSHSVAIPCLPRPSQVSAEVSLVPSSTRIRAPPQVLAGEDVFEAPWSILKVHAHFAFHVITCVLF